MLVVDDFGIKYVGSEHVTHLLTILQQDYAADVDQSRKLYCDITMQWDCQNRIWDISMPGYVKKQLQK